MYAHNLDTVVYFCLAAQKHLIGNNAGVFLVCFFSYSIGLPSQDFNSTLLCYSGLAKAGYLCGITFDDFTQDQSM